MGESGYVTESIPPHQRIAVIGAGVAGVVCAWLLQRNHEVILYEKEDRLGGHTNTQVIPYGPDKGVAIDTGFIVLNDRTYPNLHLFLAQLNIPVEPSNMSFGYWNPSENFCYAGTSLTGLFAQPKNLFRPKFHSMLLDLRRFSREARVALERGDLEGLTLGEFIGRKRYSDSFRDRYLLPMGAAIWSTSPREMLDYPAASMVEFFKNHGLLSLKDRPQWQTLSGRGSSYLAAFSNAFRGRIFKNSKIRSVRRTEGGAVVHHGDGSETDFDYVILACHANQSLALLENPTDDERRLLGPWRYRENDAFLHTDARVMPPNRRAWASWNFHHSTPPAGGGSVFVTYHMNRLQNLRAEKDYFVTLNPEFPLDPETILYQTRYEHPSYTFSSLETQAELPKLNTDSRILFCGSYFGHGFHEDAVKSGAAAAARFGLVL